MTKEALFNLFKRKRIPQWTGDALDLVACKRQIEMQPQLTVERFQELYEWAREYVTQNDTPTCAKCGCKGNMSCGHEPVNTDLLYTLDETLVCACCVKKEMPK